MNQTSDTIILNTFCGKADQPGHATGNDDKFALRKGRRRENAPKNQTRLETDYCVYFIPRIETVI